MNHVYNIFTITERDIARSIALAIRPQFAYRAGDHEEQEQEHELELLA